MRVTDLDKFALEEIWRPYQTMKGYERRLERSPMSLTCTAAELANDTTGWADRVFNRLRGIGVRFPSYVKNELVDVIKCALSGTAATTHTFVPHPRFPWFCDKCGYAPHERLQHSVLADGAGGAPSPPQTADDASGMNQNPSTTEPL